MLTSFARKAILLSHPARAFGQRAVVPVFIRALSTIHPVDFHKVRGRHWCHNPTMKLSILYDFFLQREEKVPPIAHPEGYKPSDMYEDEFEYGIAGEPNEGEEEFEIKSSEASPKPRPVRIQEPKIHLHHGHETAVDSMPLTAESRLHRDA